MTLSLQLCCFGLLFALRTARRSHRAIKHLGGRSHRNVDKVVLTVEDMPRAKPTKATDGTCHVEGVVEKHCSRGKPPRYPKCRKTDHFEKVTQLIPLRHSSLKSERGHEQSAESRQVLVRSSEQNEASCRSEIESYSCQFQDRHRKSEE